MARRIPDDDGVELHEDGSASWTARSGEVEWRITVAAPEPAGYVPVLGKQRQWLERSGRS